MTEWENLQSNTNLTTCALTAYDAAPVETTDITHPLILVGNEAHGLSHEVCKAANHRIALRMPGPAESYNAAIAGSIALYIMTSKGG